MDFDEVVLTMHTYIRSLLIFPYYPRHNMYTLYYVSCGKRGVDSIPYMELVKSFDAYVWVMLSVTGLVATTVPFWSHVYSQIGLGKHLLSSVKVMLEQGDPLLERMVNEKKLRFQIALFLLIGIVVSNAYKNKCVQYCGTQEKHTVHKLASTISRQL